MELTPDSLNDEDVHAVFVNTFVTVRGNQAQYAIILATVATLVKNIRFFSCLMTGYRDANCRMSRHAEVINQTAHL